MVVEDNKFEMWISISGIRSNKTVKITPQGINMNKVHVSLGSRNRRRDLTWDDDDFKST